MLIAIKLKIHTLPDIIPARWANHAMRLTVPTNCLGAPAGGTMMYFYVREGK